MRRKPQQDRSRQLVDSLIEACVRIIAREGLAAATAAHIASEAGVSVGSLYQYFDSKEEIYRAVLERIGDELKQLMARQVSQLSNRELDGFIRDSLNDLWTFLEANNRRYLNVIRHWAQLDFPHVINDLERQMHSVLTIYLMQHSRQVVVPDIPAKIYVLVNSIIFTLVRYISDPASHVTRDQIVDTFAEIVRSQFGGTLPGSFASSAAPAHRSNGRIGSKKPARARRP